MSAAQWERCDGDGICTVCCELFIEIFLLTCCVSFFTGLYARYLYLSERFFILKKINTLSWEAVVSDFVSRSIEGKTCLIVFDVQGNEDFHVTMAG